MPRVNYGDRVQDTWNGSWPPALKDKVRIWGKKDLRGKKATVVATHEEAMKGYKTASPDKIRIKIKNPETGDIETFMVTNRDVMPGDVTVKQIEAQQ